MTTIANAAKATQSSSRPQSDRKRAVQRCMCGGSCARCSQQGVADQVDSGLRSAWKPLEDGTRSFMESRFGAQFGDVRVHTDAQAAESASGLNALAYTFGNDIVFGPGQYSPGTATGKRLLAHELTHTLQQAQRPIPSGAAAYRLDASSSSVDAAEREAQVTSETIVYGRLNREIERHPLAVMRTSGAALGNPKPPCAFTDGDPTSPDVFRFFVNSDDFQPGEEFSLRRFAASFEASGEVDVHGFASTDGDPTFNMSLSCHRANKAAAAIRAVRGAPNVRRIFMHGATKGPVSQRRSAWIETVVPKKGKPPAPGPSGLPTLKFWINAFIPKTLSGAHPAPAGPFAGQQVFKGPIPFMNSCFETDERVFSSALPVLSRVQVFAEVDTATGALTMSGFIPGTTFEIDCDTGVVKCLAPVKPRGTILLVRSLFHSNILFILLEALANDPCVYGAPDLTIRGFIEVDVMARTFSPHIFTTFFPSFEMYVSVGGGAPSTIFQEPPTSNSVFSLLVPGVKPIPGKARSF